MLGCLAWMSDILGGYFDQFTNHRRSLPSGVVPHLPDEIVLNILGRLPVDRVVKLRRVCRDWKAMISSPYFARLELKRATSDILVSYIHRKPSGDYLHLIMLGEGSNDKPIKLSPQDVVVLSCDGLLLSMNLNGVGFFLSNPICSSKRLPISETPGNGYMIGFFYHPITSEYKLLYMKKDGMFSRYFILSVGTTFWKELFFKSFSIRPSLPVYSPAIVNGALHWIVEHDEHISAAGIHSCENAIMVFKMDAEEFFTMPNPLNVQHWDIWRWHKRMHLLVKEGSLCFCFVDLYVEFIDIWILEDYEDRIWVHKYKLDITFNLQIFPYDFQCNIGDSILRVIKLLVIRNEELILDWYGRGIFRCHLTQNTVHKFNSPKRVRWYLQYHFSGTFTKSFMTLC